MNNEGELINIYIFISYSHTDRLLASLLVDHLRDMGYTPWIDYEQLVAGKWREGIDQALRQSAVMLVLLTPEGTVSDEVHNEYTKALGMGIPVIPLMCRDCPIPDELRDYHVVNLQDGLTAEDSEKLLRPALQKAFEDALHHEKTPGSAKQAELANKITFEEKKSLIKPSSLTIVTGDRRHNPPESRGDFFAQTPSIQDLTWIFSLKLPETTIVWHDKVISTDLAETPDFLTNRHLLIVASPYSNLVSRKVNDDAFFRFNLDDELLREVNNHEEHIRKREKEEVSLEEIFRDLGGEHAQLLTKLKGLGFIDPICEDKHAGSAPRYYQDYAALSFCKHPFSDNHYAILAAGLHLAGTMTAVKLLGKPSALPHPDFFESRPPDGNVFKDRPLGGILEITIPQGNRYGKLAQARAKWLTKEYSWEQLRQKLSSRFCQSVFDRTELRQYEQLLERHKDISIHDFLSFYIG